MTRPDRRGLVTPALLAAAAAVLLVLGLPEAFGRLTPKIINSGNRAASNAYYRCSTVAAAPSSKNAYLAYPLTESSGTTATDVSGNSRSGVYSSSGVTLRSSGAPCKRDTNGGYAAKLDGASGYISGPATAVAGPSVFSLEIWFKTSVAGGKLIGFGDARTGYSGSYDRHLYIDSTGRLQFGVYPNEVKTIDSPNPVTDNKWHHAVATLSAAGMMLYLDGALVDSNSTVTTAQSASGYWRIGFDNLSYWTNAPSNAHFTGDLAWAEVYSYALTAEQAKSHYVVGAI